MLDEEPEKPKTISSSDLLRQEAARLKAMGSPRLGDIGECLYLAAAWLDSLQAPERQTRYEVVAEEKEGR